MRRHALLDVVAGRTVVNPIAFAKSTAGENCSGTTWLKLT
jgi:hypothetical protein